MSKLLEEIKNLRDEHIQFTREKYRRLDRKKLNDIISRKLARWKEVELSIEDLEERNK